LNRLERLRNQDLVKDADHVFYFEEGLDTLRLTARHG